MENQKTFNNFTYNTKCNIWRIAFQNKDIEYNLKDYYSDNYNISIYNNDKIYKGISINKLNCYYGELCTMYYVWKNNLKSDIVGFDQYRRQWTDIDYQSINDNKIQCYSYWLEPVTITKDPEMNSFFTDFLLYIKFYYPEYSDKLNYLIFNFNEIRNHINIFICKWEIFEKICTIVFGFLEHILPNEQWKNPKLLKHYIKFQVKLNYEINNDLTMWAKSILEFSNNTRYIIFMLEVLFGTLYNVISESFEFGNKSHLYVVYKCNNFEDCDKIVKLYKFNIGNGINMNNLFVCNYDKFKEYVKKHQEYDYSYCDKYEYAIKSYENYVSKHDMTNALRKNKFITLNTDEYIYSENSIELNKDNYEIKKYNI